ncbi:MAG TPA: CHAT domain-containing tetratricopeptide repeat protein [Hyphomicrobiales bacterium]|jgi:CHAT domain-containing protein
MSVRLRVIFWIYLLGFVLLFDFAARPGRAQTPGGGGQLEALDNKILELWGVGKNNEALPLHKRVVELSDKTLGPEHPQSVERAEQMAYALSLAGRNTEAKPLFLRVIKSRERLLSGKNYASLDTLPDANKLAQDYEQVGRFKDAEATYKRVLAAQEKAHGPMHPDVAKALDKLSLFYIGRDRYADQEAVLRRMLTIFEKTQDATHFADPNLPKDLVINLAHIDAINAVNQLADLYGTLGRYSEMEALAKRNLARLKNEGGTTDLMASINYSQLGRIAVVRGRYADAESYFKKAVEIEQRTPNQQVSWCDMCNDLAEVYLRQGRFDDAEKAAKKAMAPTNGTPADLIPYPSRAYLVIAQSHFARKRYGEAEKLFARVARDIEASWGPDSNSLVPAVVGMAEVKLAQGNPLESYDHAKRATSQRLRRIDANAESLTMSSGGQMRPVDFYDQSAFDIHLRAAAELALQSPDRAPALAAETFELSQRAQHSQAASALSQMAVRFAQGDGALAQQVRQRQELTEQYRGIDRQLTAAISQPNAQRNEAEEDRWRKAREDIVRRIKAIDADLAKQFPQYAALVNPAPLSVQDVQQLLRPEEVLIQISQEALDPFPYRHSVGQTYVWAITRGEARWKALPIGAETLAAEVAALRCGLDESAWRTPDRCRKLLDGKSPDATGLPYDLGRAYALYTKVFQPFADLIEGRHILFVPSGALMTFPLQALVTAPPDPGMTGAERYAKAAWLGRKQPVTVLPSVTSVKSLRSFAKKSLATNPYAGFGNPLLTGLKGDNRSAWSRQDCQPAAKGGQRVAARAVLQAAALDLFRGGRVDVAALRRQEPLPETADELCDVAGALAASPVSVFLGARATESTLKSLSSAGTLKTWRVLHFATHGLVAGETRAFSVNRAEPALLLTPPDKASEEDDGLLTASEVARLEMDADWVILSACNTAASDGAPGAEALSGLASAFIYAGARSLLVSHWYVNSESAVKLITGAFAELSRDPVMGKAEALRRSIEARIREGGGRAHPSYWAPFVIVGEGA